MKIKNLSYENFNGLTNNFTFENGLNVLTGSNGSGKTTTIDALGVLLFGESFSYNKTLEKHINIADKTQKAECRMTIQTDNVYLDEDGVEKNVEQEFAVRLEIKNDGKFTQTCFVNGTKSSQKAYYEKLANCFNISVEYLSVEKINVLRGLVDPNCISEGDNTGFYNLIKALTNVMTIQEFVNSKNDFAGIRGIIMGVDTIQEAEKLAKDSIENVENEISKVKAEMELKEKESKEINFDSASYNETIDKFESRKADYSKLQNEIKELELKLVESNGKDNLDLSNKKLEASKNISDITLNGSNLQKEISNTNILINNLVNEKNNLLKTISIQEMNIADAKKTKFETFVCVHCGKIANENDLEHFNVLKEAKIEKAQNYIDECKNNLPSVDSQLQELSNKKKELTDNVTENDNKLAEARRKFAELNGVLVEKSKATLGYESKLVDKKIEKEKIENELNEYVNILNESTNVISKKQAIEKDIDSRKENIKNLLTKKANAELKQTQIKDFKIAYAKEIESKVSSVFGDIEISMIKEGKNSKEKISCFAIKDGKPIYNYNTAPQKAIGVKIIQCIKNKLGIKGLPIIFDILDNVGEKALNEIVENADGQVFCTSATFKDNIKLHITNSIKENK